MLKIGCETCVWDTSFLDNDIVQTGNTWVHNAFGNFLFIHYLLKCSPGKTKEARHRSRIGSIWLLLACVRAERVCRAHCGSRKSLFSCPKFHFWSQDKLFGIVRSWLERGDIILDGSITEEDTQWQCLRRWTPVPDWWSAVMYICSFCSTLWYVFFSAGVLVISQIKEKIAE